MLTGTDLFSGAGGSSAGLEQAGAEALLAKAHAICPYSNALRGNVDVRLHLTVA